ncbi:Rhodanese-like domain-containing protein [Lutibacter agarilyticus]|uniref:Rhodanese-like domain-containing protein n=1 Tax=Lutibacter agarilyticus TaxID=1109740 RepID=A0A238YNC8_9FLAO|nr:rhodanese-like domain-containing protein [Lutibacter agarilyticus]SNR72776.1 Rhodanese-like domain-containing protein [Lutibacter agarilyticus]
MINRKLAKASSFRYMILACILILLAGGLVLLPKYQQHEGIKPQELLGRAISPERYISTDEVASLIINQDPSYLFIDVRDEESYNKYSLPNAINIPLDKLLDEDFEAYLNQDEYDVVLFSNDHFYANEAWIICNRLDYKNLRVLEGGLNNWFHTIINPTKPTENMAATAFELYSTRKAASMYFGVAYPEQVKKETVPAKKAVVKKTIVPVKKKKKMPTEGGC